MGMSTFNQGFAGGISIRGVPLIQTHPGNVYWVGSDTASLPPNCKTPSDGNSGTFLAPFATIDYAVGKCVAGRGDIIFVRPGHVETIIAAGGLTLDVAGIAVVGLGTGSLRPQLSFGTATSATIAISAANVTLINFRMTGDIDALSGPVQITAGYCRLIDCEYRDVTGQATECIVAGSSSDDLVIDGYIHYGAAAAGAQSAIALSGCDRPTIKNFKLIGNFSVGAINLRTAASTLIDVFDGYIWTQNAADICIVDTITASTGKIGPNICMMVTDNAANITEAITGATFQYFGAGETAGLNGASLLVCNLAGEGAMTLNKTQSTDA